MMNYQITKDSIIEIKTKHVVARSKCSKSLKTIFKKLISGSGFEGETPNFFCVRNVI